MIRKQARLGRWMVAASLATAATGTAPAAADGWLSDDGTSRSVVSDTSPLASDPPSPESLEEPGDATAASGLSRASYEDASEAVVADGVVEGADDGSWSMGDMTGWVADSMHYPPDTGPFQQPGLLQVLHDRKCAVWTFRSDALLLWRNAPRNIPLYSNLADTPNGFGATAFEAGQMESTPAAGPRFSIFRTDDCQNAWEYTWFQAANFRSQEATLPTLGGYGMTPPEGIFGNTFAPIDTVASDLSASIWSFELNRWARWTPNIALLHGFRMLGWGENLTMLDHYDTTSTGFSQDIFGSRTYNSLYGYQIGTDIRLWDRGQWIRVDGTLKGGAYYNNAVQSSFYTYQIDPDTFQTTGVRAAGGAAAFVGEVGLTGTIPITSNLALRVGYLGLWLQGLAQPTDQLRGQTLTSGGPGSPVLGSISTIGGTVVQGVSLGLEGRW